MCHCAIAHRGTRQAHAGSSSLAQARTRSSSLVSLASSRSSSLAGKRRAGNDKLHGLRSFRRGTSEGLQEEGANSGAEEGGAKGGHDDPSTTSESEPEEPEEVAVKSDVEGRDPELNLDEEEGEMEPKPPKGQDVGEVGSYFSRSTTDETLVSNRVLQHVQSLYMTVDETNGRQLYYYFVTSESKMAATDPLVLWLNGGPGCSSFDDFIYEHAKSSSSLPNLTPNSYSWSKVVSIIYVDSPAGTGYSNSNEKHDYTTGDLKTASDLYKFLQQWFVSFPEYLSNLFFIIGINAGLEPKLNFKGYAVGNGVCDSEYDGNALVPFVVAMGLISVDLYEATRQACHGNYRNDSSTDNSLLQSIKERRISMIDVRVSFQFQHNVCGRSIYAEGTMDAVLFLAKKIEQKAAMKVYNMIDILRGGNMR